MRYGTVAANAPYIGLCCSTGEQASVDRLSVLMYGDDTVVRLMTRSGVSRHSVLVAGLVALVYPSLAVMASACAFGHVGASSGHEHHGSQGPATHNALCAWACQATTDAGLAVDSPISSTGPMIRQILSPPSQHTSSLFSSLFHSRAPPSASFILPG